MKSENLRTLLHYLHNKLFHRHVENSHHHHHHRGSTLIRNPVRWSVVKRQCDHANSSEFLRSAKEKRTAGTGIVQRCQPKNYSYRMKYMIRIRDPFYRYHYCMKRFFYGLPYSSPQSTIYYMLGCRWLFQRHSSTRLRLFFWKFC